MAAAKLKSEQQIEESKDESADVTDATKIAVEDNFDIDDIWAILLVNERTRQFSRIVSPSWNKKQLALYYTSTTYEFS